ncbi:NAD-dependent DNA ligase [Klosneuvirus KNV1]|uniref:DNA ligase (NAD(+)) n=1 Tax=Klosneuvirus KNV1 TaxID=1977640 RepID=A0A1V0SI75_9VIRU|nr:NAD-dependent DNA ligase [Klosneuvirus KNV1]
MTTKIDILKKKVDVILKDPYVYATTAPIKDLVELLKQLSHHYYHTAEPLISDSVYDLLKDTLEERDPKNPFLKEVGALVVSKDKVNLPYPMGSLNKIKPDSGTLDKWLKEYKGPYIISDKLDGISGLLHKKNNKFKLYTRGDAITGQDITHLIQHVLKDKYKPGKIPDDTAIRGELIMSKKNFETIKDQYKNARNTVAGLVNSKHFSIDVANLTDFIAYAVINPKMKQEEQMAKLKEWEFPTVTNEKKNMVDIKSLSEYLQKRRSESLYDIDGIVVIDSEKVYNVTDTNPEYGFAFKMINTEQVAEVTVLDIEWNISKNGYLKPVVKIAPITLSQVSISNLTAFNAKYVVDNNLGPGSVIKIVRSGDVIPHILEVLKPSSSGKPKMPDIPYKWNKTNVDIVVQDTHGAASDAIMIKQITFFFKTLGVKNISEGVVTKLVQHGYKTIQAILKADQDKLAKIEGLGDKSITKIYENIEEAFKQTDLATLMASSNIFGRGMGVRKITIITKAYPNIMMEKWNKKELLDNILALHGFDDITATQFANNFEKFKDFLKDLEDVDLIDVTKYSKKIKTVEKKDNTFEGMKIVFTGFRSKELEDYIVARGGQVTGTVSKNTNAVLYAEGDTTGSKYLKAKELAIPLMTEKEFREKYKITK